MSKFLGYAVVWNGKSSGNTFITSGMLLQDKEAAHAQAHNDNRIWPDCTSFVVEIHEPEVTA